MNSSMVPNFAPSATKSVFGIVAPSWNSEANSACAANYIHIQHGKAKKVNGQYHHIVQRFHARDHWGSTQPDLNAKGWSWNRIMIASFEKRSTYSWKATRPARVLHERQDCSANVTRNPSPVVLMVMGVPFGYENLEPGVGLFERSETAVKPTEVDRRVCEAGGP